MVPLRTWLSLCLLVSCALPTLRAQDSELDRLLSENRYEEAIPLLANKVQENPGDDTARLRLGQILNFQGQPERAIAIWRDGLEKGVSDPQFWLVMGDLYRQMAEDGPTVLRIGGAVTYQPNQGFTNEKQWRQERWDKAVEAYRNLVEAKAEARSASPDDPALMQQLTGASVRVADTLQASGNLDAAEVWWKHVLELDPTHETATKRVEGMKRLREDVSAVANAIVAGKETVPRDSPIFSLAADEAIKILQQQLQANPGDDMARTRLGQMLAYQGEMDEALITWQEGLDGAGDDAELWLQIGDLYRAQAEKSEAIIQASAGSGGLNGNPAAQPDARSQEEIAEEQLKARDTWQQAVTAYENVVRARPDNPEAITRLAHALQGTKQNEAAELWWKYLFEKDPTNDLAAIRYASLQMQREDVVGAGGTLMAGLDADPRNAALWAFGAQLSEQMGDAVKAQEALTKAKFYGWLPPFCEDVEFSEENAAFVAALRDPAELSSAVDELIAQPAPATSQLLAAVCWHRKSHGEVENRCFDELVRRGDSDLLLQLFHTGKGSFTIRYAAQGLAKLKHPQAFDLLVELLPNDNKPMWHLDIANSLAILGDPRAVEPLIQVLSPELTETRTNLANEDPSIATDGVLFARHRAALALGKFNDPRATQALNKGLTNLQIAVACNAALFRQNGQTMHLRAIQPIRGEMRDILIDYVSEIQTQEAQELVAFWKDAKEQEKAAIEAEQKRVLEERVKNQPKPSQP